MYGALDDYTPPEWAASLSFIPKKRVHLSMTNTPIHPWKLPGLPADFNVSVKRDDLTGSTLTGNKVRKLEFLLGEAMERGCRHVITCGIVQSNHCRATALSSRQLGLTPHLFLQAKSMDVGSAGCEGNMLLNRLCGAHLYLVPDTDPYLTHLLPRMDRLAQHIKSSTGEDSYQIPMGGSSKTGLFGYITLFEELRQQGVLDQFDDLVFPGLTGGTPGLAISNYLTGGKLRLHAVRIKYEATYIYDYCDRMLKELGMEHVRSRDLFRLVEGFDGEGYGVSTDEEMEFIRQVATQTAINLDPVYSGKTALAMVREMATNPSAFKGRRVLFLHTGGLFALFNNRVTSFLKDAQTKQDLLRLWPKVEDTPFACRCERLV